MKCYKVKIGRVLVNHNLITQEQLDECLSHQKCRGGILGEILVSKGYVSAQDLEEYLTFQKERVCPLAS